MQDYLTDLTTDQNPDDPEISPLCQVNCKTCNSKYLQEIHKMKLDDSYALREISSELEKKYNEKISIASLSQHFQHYFSYVKNRTQKKIVEYVEKEVDQRAEHVLKVNALINRMFSDLSKQWQIIPPTIDNLKSLFQIQHNLMNGISQLGNENEQIEKLINSSEINPDQLNLFNSQTTGGTNNDADEKAKQTPE